MVIGTQHLRSFSGKGRNLNCKGACPNQNCDGANCIANCSCPVG